MFHITTLRKFIAPRRKELLLPLFEKEGQGEIFRIAKSPLVPLCKRGNKPNLARFAPLRESSFSGSIIQEQTSNMFG
jgi:hypothetical protein